ncbi:hypothetical protein PATSB16_14640 [Pandoraea thiooxydans]|nr:hypothetical protein PATSB16_14640 [Pandoraea thiooxydans]
MYFRNPRHKHRAAGRSSLPVNFADRFNRFDSAAQPASPQASVE